MLNTELRIHSFRDKRREAGDDGRGRKKQRKIVESGEGDGNMHTHRAQRV